MQPAAVHHPTEAQEQSNLPGAHSERRVVHSEELVQLPVPTSTSCTGVGHGALALGCAPRGMSALRRHQDSEKRMLELSGEGRRGLAEERSMLGLLGGKGMPELLGELGMLGLGQLAFGAGSLGILIEVGSRLESSELADRSHHRQRLLIETWHPVAEAFLGFGDLGCGCAALDFDAPDLRDLHGLDLRVLDCVGPGFVAPGYADHGSGVGCVA